MRRSAVALLALCFGALMVVPAEAAIVTAGPGGFVAGFLPPVVVYTSGDSITFVNGDVAPHNFTSADQFLPKKAAAKSDWCSSFDKGRCPLFWSATVTAGESAEVQGLGRLRSGKQYTFTCTIHPGMKGTLIVQ